MKNLKKAVRAIFTVGAVTFIFTACTTDPNSPGVEYMPDMYRSPSIEPYVDYGEVRGEVNEDAKNTRSALHPPKGTIPYYGKGENVSIMLPYEHGAPKAADVTHGLYGVKQDPNGYKNAASDKNPIPYSEAVLEEGKDLYTKFCQHCHGENGDGQGKIAQNGAIQGIPDYATKLKDLPEGQIFYSITYGKGLMGSHASQLNKAERWKVTHYVKALQNGGTYPTEGEATTDSTAMDTGVAMDSTAVSVDSTVQNN